MAPRRRDAVDGLRHPFVTQHVQRRVGPARVEHIHLVGVARGLPMAVRGGGERVNVLCGLCGVCGCVWLCVAVCGCVWLCVACVAPRKLPTAHKWRI